MSLARGFLYSTLSGILLAASWPPHGFPLLLFVAFVPLLLFEQGFYERIRSGGKFKLYSIGFWAFLIWNSITVWWIWNSSREGMFVAILLNTFLMSTAFFFFHMFKRRMGERIGNFAFAIVWIAYEYFHHQWDLSWPWLTLGNAFAGIPWLIQWYEYTGVLGGSLWVLVINVLIARLCLKTQQKKIALRIILAVIFVIPVVYSQLLNFHIQKKASYHIVLIQPNFDPYKIKFDLDAEAQMKIFLSMADSMVKPGTKLLILPETAVSDGIYEDRYYDSRSLYELQEYARAHPGLKIITGASTWKVYKNHETPSVTARKYGNAWYDSYNTALFIDSTGVLGEYHKSKLVPGVEKMPYPKIFGFLKDYAVDLGGISGTLASQEEREVFVVEEDGIVAAPVICYESVFGEYVGGYIRNGANAIIILTNDGWWGDTPGYRQHLIYGAVRAIEYRVPVIRCTNTGISCFIDAWGNVTSQSTWWTREAIEGTIKTGSGLTFYAKCGDYIGNAAVILFPFLFLMTFFLKNVRQES